MPPSARCPAAFAALFLLAFAGAVQAQATRTWISGVGDDANPCSRTAPCRTFAGAISKTTANGIINVLDPGAYGSVTITKALTIEAEGAVASTLASGTNGIIVNAGANDVVALRNIKIAGIGAGLHGISFINGGGLVLDGVVIENFTRSGISMTNTGVATVNVRDVLIRGSGSAADAVINLAPGPGGSINGSFERVQLVRNGGTGLQIQGSVSVGVRDSTASTNGGNGFAVIGSGVATQLMLDGIIANDNSLAGVLAQGSGAILRLSNSTLSGNAQGIQATTGAQVVSFGNNRNRGNLSDGAPTSTVPMQ